MVGAGVEDRLRAAAGRGARGETALQPLEFGDEVRVERVVPVDRLGRGVEEAQPLLADGEGAEERLEVEHAIGDAGAHVGEAPAQREVHPLSPGRTHMRVSHSMSVVWIARQPARRSSTSAQSRSSGTERLMRTVVCPPSKSFGT